MCVRLEVFLVDPPHIQSVLPTRVGALLQRGIVVIEGDDIEPWEVVLHARLESGQHHRVGTIGPRVVVDDQLPRNIAVVHVVPEILPPPLRARMELARVSYP